MDVGETATKEIDIWLTPCPTGSRVDGYQVIKGGLIYQIRPRCSCVNCGASHTSAACTERMSSPLPPLHSSFL